MTPVAIYHCPVGGKFGLPRQSGVAPELRGSVELQAEFRDPNALRGLDGFDYVWLLWGFSENRDDKWRPTVRPPRLGGNARMGVFATRSPYHPNAIGLSCVKVEGVDFQNCTIFVSGADLADGTPVYDIKPYLSYTDSHPEARCGFAGEGWPTLEVDFPEELRNRLSAEDASALAQLLSQDPRPHYQDSPGRVYSVLFGPYDVKFTVEDGLVKVLSFEEPRPGISG
ncbi:MAG: tRNA (N6-threonylcarbamoyladenosine(37)-N6)-methyltransferase TrmO [Bacteroidales bacterium]|nr:tRNA (N6-threonylcarbamoyladenosine(37)-N6)-methyltransferase TrmO [Bacteroidales bacterium]